jgi:RNA polymerase sigma factor (sigma-70 family)
MAVNKKLATTTTVPQLSEEEFHRIVLDNMPLVSYVIKRAGWHKHICRGRNITMEDLRQEGAIGLMNAVMTHDPTKGKLSTYAYTCINNAIRRFVDKNISNALTTPQNCLWLMGSGQDEGSEKMKHLLLAYGAPKINLSAFDTYPRGDSRRRESPGRHFRREFRHLIAREIYEKVLRIARKYSWHKSRSLVCVSHGVKYGEVGKKIGITKQGVHNYFRDIVKVVRESMPEEIGEW